MRTAILILLSALFWASVVMAFVAHALSIRNWRNEALGAVVCAAFVALILMTGGCK